MGGGRPISSPWTFDRPIYSASGLPVSSHPPNRDWQKRQPFHSRSWNWRKKGGGERNWNWEWRTSAKLESLRIQSERSDPSLWTRTSAWVAQSFIFVYANQFPSHTAIMRGPAMASCVPLESLARFAPQHCHNVIWFVSHAPLQLVAYRPQFGMHADWSQRSCLYTPQQLTRIDSIAT